MSEIALCYSRKSRVFEESDRISPERQHRALEAWCHLNDYTPEWYEDAEGYLSGRTQNRPAFQLLKLQLTRPNVKVVVFETVSRLFRNLKELLLFEEECKQEGVRLVSIREQFDTDTPMGRFTLQMLGALAEIESNQTSDRVASTFEMLRYKQGRYFGSVPFGTLRQPDGKLAPDPIYHGALVRLYRPVRHRAARLWGHRLISSIERIFTIGTGAVPHERSGSTMCAELSRTGECIQAI